MDLNNTNQQSQPNQPSPLMQSSLNPTHDQKGNFLIPIGIIMLILVVGAGAYYLGTKNISTPSSKQQERTSNYQAPTAIPTQSAVSQISGEAKKNWKTETIQIKKETAVSGNETISMSLQLPTDWSIQTYNQPSNPKQSDKELYKLCCNFS